jgi:hypothetical protein
MWWWWRAKIVVLWIFDLIEEPPLQSLLGRHESGSGWTLGREHLPAGGLVRCAMVGRKILLTFSRGSAV